MDKYFEKCETLIHDKLGDERIFLPAGLYIGHLLTALFYAFATGDANTVVLGTFFFGWAASIIVWLVWLVTTFVLAFCLAVAYAIALILRPPIAGIRSRLRR